MFIASLVIGRIHLNVCGLVTHKRLNKWPKLEFFFSYIMFIYFCVVMGIMTLWNPLNCAPHIIWMACFVCAMIPPNSKCVCGFEIDHY
jgi:hypothetical protein